HGVFNRHRSCNRLLQKPAEDVGLRGPGGGRLLSHHDREPRGFSPLLDLTSSTHRVLVGDRDEIEARLHGRVDQLGRGHHAVGRERVAVGIGEHYSNQERTKASGSNGSRSSIASPTPASLTGTSSSFSIAITAPPLALPS